MHSEFVPKLANCQSIEAEFNKKMTEFSWACGSAHEEWILEDRLQMDIVYVGSKLKCPVFVAGEMSGF